MLSLSCIFKKIVPRLFHPHSFKISVNKVLRKQVVYGYTKILGGGHLTREALINIEIGMVKSIDHVFLYATIQVGQIANHTRDWIHRAAHRNLNHIVMPMAVRIAALAVDFPVFLLAVGVGIQAMRCTEDVSPRQVSSHASP
jgi:hypothetical protein